MRKEKYEKQNEEKIIASNSLRGRQSSHIFAECVIVDCEFFMKSPGYSSGIPSAPGGFSRLSRQPYFFFFLLNVLARRPRRLLINFTEEAASCDRRIADPLPLFFVGDRCPSVGRGFPFQRTPGMCSGTRFSRARDNSTKM